MLGAVIGDIVGSRFEWNNIKTKDFEFFSKDCFFTDDTIMTLAIAKTVLKSKIFEELRSNAVYYMKLIGKPYPNSGYGGSFFNWIYSADSKPYNSFGNGAAMRVSACGLAAETIEEAIAWSREATCVTHNHPEGLKGAEAVAVAIFMAKAGRDKAYIREFIHYRYYPMDFTLDGIRDTYSFNETCQETVPQALMAFFESTSFEDAIRNAISIGGDSDTLAAITGSVAEAYYGIPENLRKQALTYLDDQMLAIVNEFEAEYGIPQERQHRKQ